MRWVVPLFGATLWMLSCTTPPPLETSPQAIVNGTATDGFLPVGALTREQGGVNSGTYCSGTLVAPQWVLTAGHCLDKPNGIEALPITLSFFLGDQLTMPPIAADPGPKGHYFADARILHPQYNPLFFFNDVALLHLTRPVVGVVPYPLRSAPIDDGLLSSPVTFVGFGKTGQNQGGTGTKRVATMPLAEIQGTYVVTEFQGSGVCEGDSGGPALLPTATGFELAGVISGLVGGTPDICHSDASASRVDAYRDWILQHIEGGGPDCSEHPDMCLCPSGCQEPGPCNVAACELTSCLALGACLADCEGGALCELRCQRRAVGDVAAVWQNLELCLDACDGNGECKEQSCLEEAATCAASAPEGQRCPQLQDCLSRCSGPACQEDCLGRGDVTEAALAQALFDCVDADLCAELEGLCDADHRCQDDQDCPATEACTWPVAGAAAGLCGCRDDDGDLWCATDDCDDTNLQVNPGIGELCFDGLDNDCDLEVDEGCPVVTAPDPQEDGRSDLTAPEVVAVPQEADLPVPAPPGACAISGRPPPGGAPWSLGPWLLLAGLLVHRLLRARGRTVPSSTPFP